METTQISRCEAKAGRGRCTHEALQGSPFCGKHQPEPVTVEAVEPAVVEPGPETEFKRCGCGCGRIVNRKREFAQGHDSKLKSALLRQWDDGQGAMAEELVERGWYSWEDLFARREKREAKEARKAAKAAKGEER